MSRELFLGGAVVCVLCWGVLVGCGSRTGFLDGGGDGLSLPDDVTGDAGSGGSAGAGGLGFAGGSMVGGGGSFGQMDPDVDRPPRPDPPPGCASGGAFEGNVVIFGNGDLAQLEGCREVRGDLQIQARIADLRPLRSLEEVRGTLGIVRGPLSLEGLENLRQVQNLQLDSIQASSLLPLAGLQRVRRLSISGDVPQGNLSGLGGIVNLRDLVVDNSSLPSLAGLAVPPRMSSILITNSSTVDLSVLAGVLQVERELTLSNVRGLLTLDVLSSPRTVRVLQVIANPDLVHIDGLTDAEQLQQIVVADNPQLDHLPDFDALLSVDFVSIERNAALRNVPRFGLGARFERVVIQGNPALDRVIFPALGVVSDANDQGSLTIADNQLLTRISVPSLESANNLIIADNPSLTTVETPTLQAVTQRLTVVMNAALPSANLGILLTATTSLRKVGGNQGDSPLASCPGTNDDHCDEASNVCAAGSDLVDCSAGQPPW